MYTTQSPALVAALMAAGVDPQVVNTVMQVFGNCAQPLQNNAQIAVTAALPMGSTLGAVTAINGNNQPTAQAPGAWNQSGPFSFSSPANSAPANMDSLQWKFGLMRSGGNTEAEPGHTVTIAGKEEFNSGSTLDLKTGMTVTVDTTIVASILSQLTPYTAATGLVITCDTGSGLPVWGFPVELQDAKSAGKLSVDGVGRILYDTDGTTAVIAWSGSIELWKTTFLEPGVAFNLETSVPLGDSTFVYGGSTVLITASDGLVYANGTAVLGTGSELVYPNGVVFFTGTTLRAPDGSAGFTGTVSPVTTITVKNGIVTNVA